MYNITDKKQTRILDNATIISDSQDIKAVNLSIKATHSGKINGNFVFYTPRSMRTGATTLIKPFNKHLQRFHNGEAIGEIKEASYVEYDNLPLAIQELVNKIDNSTTPQELVNNVKALINTKEFKNKTYKGVGFLNVNAELHDPKTILDLRSGDKGKVSIGGKSKNVYCSICSTPNIPCKNHNLGETYNGELCFNIYDNMLLDHIGFVPNPADDDTYSVIEDSLNDNDILITGYNINNKEGNQMKLTLELLKEQAANIDGLIDKHFTDASKNAKAKELYAASLKNSRASSYVFGQDKVLNTRSIIGAFLAEKLAEDLDDEEDKLVINTQVQSAYKKLLQADETIEQAIERFLAEEVVQEVEATVEPETQPEEVAATVDTAQKIEDNVQTQEVVEDIATAALETLIETMAGKILSGVEELLNKQTETKIEDNKKLLFEQLETLRTEVQSSEDLVRQLTNDYASSIIQQILILKGRLNDSTYKEKLSKRSIEVLKTTLEDTIEEHKVESSITKTTDTNTQLQTATIEDSLKGAATNVTETETKPEIVEDKTLDIKDELQVQDWFSNKTKEVGLSAALAEFKKIKNINI
jgi:hypothetical protein